MFLRVALVTVALALAGCGGDDGPSASEEYANGVCSTLSTWATDVETTLESLGETGLATDREDLENAVGDVRSATDTLVDDLGDLGPPETEAGNEAKSEFDQLTTVLTQQVDTVEEALDSGGGITAIAATVTAAISTAASAINATYQNLQQLDPADELRDAFEDSDECEALQDQLERNSS